MYAVLVQQRARRAEVLNYTIVELLILFLFAALAFFFIAREESVKQVTVLEADLDRAMQRIESLKRKLEAKEQIIANQRTEIRELEEKLEDRERYIRQLEQAVAERLPPEALEELEKGKGDAEAKLVLLKLQLEEERRTAAEVKSDWETQVSKLQRQLREAWEALEKERTTLGQHRAKLADAQEQLAKLAKAQGKGLDHPRCVVLGAEDISTVYTVVMHPFDFEIESQWPTEQDARFFAIPGFREMGTRARVSRPHFASAGRKIYDWSTSQRPQCRFIVKVIDRTGNDKTAYVKQLRTIEYFFYKR